MNIDPNKLLSSKIGEAELNLNKMVIQLKNKVQKNNSQVNKSLTEWGNLILVAINSKIKYLYYYIPI